ncbi:DNA double-strand break repair nuclease NurA [Deinococcus sp. NW-56]|uniref:DNA double-strand break repair nuclease NurA n=1 Tax=Deinococcus sp. NW-56 TaxID=2080419 RepID=UPI000CF3EE3E|nr:DNA double-strand break repair nuclease NurA [Deinococcus sp. NW-56]
MPHEGERAGVTTSLKRLLSSDEAQKLKARLQNRAPSEPPAEASGIIVERPDPSKLPRFVIAIDGSQGAVQIEEGFPGAEVGVVTVASVMIDLHKLREARVGGIPDPRKFRNLHEPHGIEVFLPSTNMVLDACGDARESYRNEFFRVLGEKRLAEDGESLLETYEALLVARADTGADKLACPLLESCTEPKAGHKYHQALGTYTCACGKKVLFSTDALRIHESFMDAGSNQTVITESRSVVEHLVLVNYLRYFEKKKMWGSIEDVAFVMDGPLAVSGHPAWLAMSIKKELQRLAEASRKAAGVTPIIFGIEKTGMFQEHLKLLDQRVQKKTRSPDQRPDPRKLAQKGFLEPGRVILVNDGYTKKHIIFKYEPPDVDPDLYKAYGATSHYGRKVLYKTASGALITAMPAFLKAGDDDMKAEACLDQFNSLGAILSLLDALVSNAFRDATIPLVVAHAEASLPARANESVLKRFFLEHQKAADPS